MSIQVIECEQGSDAWFLARAGVPTASCFDTVLAKGRSGGPSVTRRKYMLRLIGEQFTRQPEATHSNAHMERGQQQEPEARAAYSFVSETEPQLVGFLRNDHAIKGAVIGCSPDSLIGDDGMCEIKTMLPSIYLEMALSGEVPAEHKAQVQGNLLVSERTWIDFVGYSKGLKLFVRRVYRDDIYIATLKIGLQDFIAEMNDLKVRLAKVAA